MRCARTCDPRRSSPESRIENAIASVAASGGSTNAVLHFLAIAREVGVELNIDDFDRISKRTPFFCDLTPSGKYVASDYQAAGGSRLLAERLLRANLIDGSALTISGKTLAEEAADAVEAPGQKVISLRRTSAEAHRRAGDPQGQSRSGRFGDEDCRGQSRGTSRSGACV